MPRYRRQHAPGAVQHVVSRFVDNEFRLDHDGARAEYLRRVPRALERSGWKAIAFALMSSHVHWALVASSRPSDSFVRSLNGGFASWLNRAQGRRGPVFADRHRTVICTGESAAFLLAYLHNNPVRARVTSSATESLWTSHRAYVGLAPVPDWLDIELGLQLCGFAPTAAGRQGFGAFVTARTGEPRSVELNGGDMQRQRREARVRWSGPVEVASPLVERRRNGLALHVPVVVPDGYSVPIGPGRLDAFERIRADCDFNAGPAGGSSPARSRAPGGERIAADNGASRLTPTFDFRTSEHRPQVPNFRTPSPRSGLGVGRSGGLRLGCGRRRGGCRDSGRALRRTSLRAAGPGLL